MCVFWFYLPRNWHGTCSQAIAVTELIFSSAGWRLRLVSLETGNCSETRTAIINLKLMFFSSSDSTFRFSMQIVMAAELNQKADFIFFVRCILPAQFTPQKRWRKKMEKLHAASRKILKIICGFDCALDLRKLTRFHGRSHVNLINWPTPRKARSGE